MPALKKIGAACLAAFGWTTGAGAVSASYLIVAGGGSGGSYSGGGGGAGGYQTGTTSLSLSTSYTVVVGAGGPSINGAPYVGNNGSNSTFGTLTASVGGGAGGGSNVAARSGGSGGGASYTGSAGTGTAGQGTSGGVGYTDGSTYAIGGGGGGATSAGGNSSTTVGGGGGNGTASSISGTSVTYAGGGGGSADSRASTTGGTGGTGGGGAGGGMTTNGTPGTANTGGGGGGGGVNGAAFFSSGSGGSGIVIISYAGAQQFGGGIVTSSGGNTIHTFTTSGTLSPLNSLSASYLIVAGGGGGGGQGGGGAGGLLSGSSLTIDTNSTYLVTVGAGGTGGNTAGSPARTNGSNSSFSIVSTTAVGGGAGGNFSASNGLSGGSGGGGGGADSGGTAGTGGTGTAGQGYAGGTGSVINTTSGGGGGGGASAIGGNGANNSYGGAGGTGVASSISGTSTYYAGGGSGGGSLSQAGGTGGGGAGGGANQGGSAGTANTGGGGGGGGNTSPQTGGNGGSGIVIISYPGSTQQMAGGSVTITGGNVIHTFTSSGYLTPLTYFNNSLRFRSSASAYLSRTPTVASNRKTWTFSTWVKRGQFVGGMYQGYVSTSSFTAFGWGGTGASTLFMQDFVNGSYNLVWETTALFRDPAAWYHVVFAYDSTQSSSANALKLYVNGVQQTLGFTAYSGAYVQNRDSFINATNSQQIGTYSNNVFYDGYMTNINFIDGQALTPNSFGAFNSYGVWQPINYGGSYGTNGFYLPFNQGSSTYAGTFNASNYLTTPYNVNWSTIGDFTMEAWIYPTAFSATVNQIGGTAQGANDGYSFFYYYTNGRIAFGINGTNEIVSGTGVINANTWYHVAVVHSGSNLTIYVNGQSVATTGSASTYLSNNSRGIWIGGQTVSANSSIGSISNFRFATRAIYTSNFVPTNAPLTAVANTQLLTLQNATIVDNSTNAYTITNVGSVTVAANSLVFANPYALSADQSPQGNNWTPVNISTTAGSTYDSMTDVPTLTSATAANYCVLNPLTYSTSGYTLSNGNLRIAGTTGTTLGWNSYGTMAFNSTDKYYFEVTYQATDPAGMIVGIAPANSLSWGGSTGNANNGYGYYSYDGTKQIAGTGSAYGATWTAGDVIGIAFDAGAGTLTFYKNNVSQGTAATGLTSGPYLPWVRPTSDTSVAGSVATVNFGQQPFVYTPPAGYVALNTYNM